VARLSQEKDHVKALHMLMACGDVQNGQLFVSMCWYLASLLSSIGWCLALWQFGSSGKADALRRRCSIILVAVMTHYTVVVVLVALPQQVLINPLYALASTPLATLRRNLCAVRQPSVLH
jgi:hypothetical protein